MKSKKDTVVGVHVGYVDLYLVYKEMYRTRILLSLLEKKSNTRDPMNVFICGTHMGNIDNYSCCSSWMLQLVSYILLHQNI